jgi:hypothetical protein
MQRTTYADLDYWTSAVNIMLAEANSNRRVEYRRHHSNTLTKLVECDRNRVELTDAAIFTGTKGECESILRAMVKMGYFLTEI